MNDFERKTLTHRIRQMQELPLPVKNLVAFRTLFKSGKINEREAAMAFDHGFHAGRPELCTESGTGS